MFAEFELAPLRTYSFVWLSRIVDILRDTRIILIGRTLIVIAFS